MLQIILDLSLEQAMILIAVALFIGMSKTGVQGLGLAAIPLLALVFGARESTGLMVPMLIMADIYAVLYYHRSANWKHILRLLPWAIFGILAGVIAGAYISHEGFRILLSGIVVAGLGIMVLRERKGSGEKIPTGHWFAAIIGILGGFASMVGNAAGPVFAVYLLAMRLPKNSLIGTGAWFYFIINLFKLPFHIWIWKTVSLPTLTLNLAVLPFILIGAWLGIQVVKAFSEKAYRIFVVATTLVSALVLIIR